MIFSRRGLTGATALMTALLVSLPAPAFAVAPEVTTESPATSSFTFRETSGTTWTVPQGVSSVAVQMRGGDGARGGGDHGGGRGYAGGVSFTLPVTPGDVLTAYGATAGGSGGAHKPGRGYVSGGTGGDRSSPGTRGGGGGGAAALLQNGALVAIAGGGGGGGGGAKWDPLFGDSRDILGGAGGSVGEAGSRGRTWEDTHPGAGGAGAARPGKSGGNGSSAASFSRGGGGGGGGGGLASGNGGSSGKKWHGDGAGGGGGGGSNFVAPIATDARAGVGHGEDPNGYVQISYPAPAHLSVTRRSRGEAGVASSVIVQVSDPDTGAPLDGRVSLRSGTTSFGSAQTSSGRVNLGVRWYGDGTYPVTVEFTPDDGGPVTWYDFTMRVGGYLEATPPGPGASDLRLALDELTVQAGGVVRGTVALVAADGMDTAARAVDVLLDGTVVQTVTTDAAGTAAVSFPAPATVRTAAVEARFAGDTDLTASTSETLPLPVVEEHVSVTASVSDATVVYGEPVDLSARAAAADGLGRAAPTGDIVFFADGTPLLSAPLDAAGEATATDVILPVGTTSVTALYAGDDTYGPGNHTTSVSVADAATTTTLTVANASGRAGDETEIDVVVTAEPGSVLEPAGHIELRVDDEVFDTASIGEDADTAPRDGVSRWVLDTAELPAGERELTARFVPGPGYRASASAPTTLTLERRSTEVRLSTATVDAAPGTEVTVHADVLLPATSARRTAPAIDGSLVVTLDGEVLGTPTHLAGTASATLTFSAPPVGAHRLSVAFHPDDDTVATSEAALTVRVAAAAAPAGRPSTPGPGPLLATAADPLPATGGATASVLPLAAGGALAIGLGAIVLLARRRLRH